MAEITMWTKQHISVLDALEATGRYTARRQGISLDMEDTAPLVLEAYDWLVRRHPRAAERPEDAEYPVWLSYAEGATMLSSPGSAILELRLEEGLITPINIAKWGAILNYSYIPADDKDARRHQELLAAYRTSDAQAFMSRFYPDIKREIVQSWDRLFDGSIKLGNDYCYGLVWELRREWIVKATR